MMGGSGNNSEPSLSPDDLQARASARTEQAQYETQTEELLRVLLRNFNDRDISAVRQHLDTIIAALSDNLDEGSVDLLFGGSVAKHTYVNGLSDVDILACLNDTSLEGLSPGDVLIRFESDLRRRLPRTTISAGDLAVTVKFSDGHEIQILPSVRTATGFRIADPNTGNWSNVVAPRRFARRLTALNQVYGGRIVPVIKLAKVINNNLPKPMRLSGYHIESLAIEAFKSYSGRNTYREMSRHFWSFAQKQVNRPIVDETGQSRHVDDYLGRSNSVARRKVRNAIAGIVAKLERADNLRSHEVWRALLEV